MCSVHRNRSIQFDACSLDQFAIALVLAADQAAKLRGRGGHDFHVLRGPQFTDVGHRQRFGDSFIGDTAGGAGSAVDDDLLTQQIRQFGREWPPRDVDGAAGGEAVDQAYGTCGVWLGAGKSCICLRNARGCRAVQSAISWQAV